MSSDWIKLNVFQRLTRQWDAMHPYNGGQLMQLGGQPDLERLSETLNTTLDELGLGQFECRDGRFRVHRLSTPIRVELIAPETGLEGSVTAELNRPFDWQLGVPFRALAVRADDSYYVGLIYHHWAADSYSVRLLLHEWLIRLRGENSSRPKPVRIAREGFYQLFGPDRARWNLLDHFLDSAKWNARFKKVRRVDKASSEDLSTHFSLHRAEDGLIDRLLSAARRLGVKVNDLFLAAMARVCHAVPTLRRTPWRDDLALGTIVDLRGMAPARWPSSFGLFLGFTSLFVRPAELDDDALLIETVRRQQKLLLEKRSAQASMLRMTAGLVLAKILRPASLTEFYRKRLALSAGISNVNLNPHWPTRYYPDVLKSYVRISPVGPMMPIVFTPTTLGSSLNLGLTCRRNVVGEADAPALAGHFLNELTRFARKWS